MTNRTRLGHDSAIIVASKGPVLLQMRHSPEPATRRKEPGEGTGAAAASASASPAPVWSSPGQKRTVPPTVRVRPGSGSAKARSSRYVTSKMFSAVSRKVTASSSCGGV